MTPILAATVAPALLMLAVAYPLRPQCGRLRTRPVPARHIIDRLNREPSTPLTFPPIWTVQR